MRWIVVDGIDGSGKSTVARMINDHYAALGEEVLIEVHPSGRRLGRVSRRALQGSGRMKRMVATVFFILDMLNSLRMLRGRGKRYQTIIYVRYMMGTAYLPQSLAPTGYDFFRKLLPVPDHLILVDIDPRVALSRISERKDHMEMFEDLDSLDRVRRRVLILAGDDWEVVDNNGSEAELRERIMKIIDRWDR